MRDRAKLFEDVQRQLRVIRAIAPDPYVAGSDIIGEEINDIRELKPVLRELVSVAAENDGFVIRIHAGENDSLRDNVANSLACVKESLSEGQKMPYLRIGHGLYTANLNSPKGKQLIEDLRESRAVLEFQLTSNVRLNNLTALANHPLKQYLRGGVSCVQGTDGGAIYGTDSIDEQLALERLLDLSYDDMLKMRESENRVLTKSLDVFNKKAESFNALLNGEDIEEFLNKRIEQTAQDESEIIISPQKLDSEAALKEQIREIPTDKVPVILLGGSFRLTVYERELAELAGERFEIYAIVPTRITPAEASRLKRANVGIRVSIEPTGMGLYKSFAYEIFKRRPSVVVALDGNSAGANTIQEAKNGKREARIFVYRGAKVLYSKAQAIQGYVSTFDGAEVIDSIIASVDKVYKKMK